MAGSSKVCHDSELFHTVFTEGPLEVLMSQCDATTAASLVGSCKHILQSAKDSATLPASQPFGLPCVLHSHPTRRPWEYNDDLEVVGCPCKLTPLDRFSSDSVMPNDLDEQRAGANGDWIVTIGLEFKWDLVHVYTRRKISLPPVPGLVATDSALTFADDGDDALPSSKLQKIVICQVPTAAGGFADFSLLALFDFHIAFLEGQSPNGWTILGNHLPGRLAYYCDAIIQDNLVFAVTKDGSVYGWEPQVFGPFLIHPPHEAIYMELELDEYEEHETDPGTWWLARSPNGSRLLLVYTRGVDGAHAVSDDSVVHYGRTVVTYASGFHCMVFSMDTRQLHQPWEMITDLGSYSLFLGVNYPINIEVGGANVAPGHLTRSNYVYTSHQAIGLEDRPRPEICRFSLNGDPAVGFSTNTTWSWSETPFWFIPTFTNALDWNKPVNGYL